MTRIAVLLLILVTVASCGDGDDASDVDAGAGTATSAPGLPAGDESDESDEQGTRPVGGEDVYAIADLAVEVADAEGATVTYRLSCLGDTATIDDTAVDVSAEAACRQLTDVEAVSLLVDGPAVDRVCPQIYGGPDEAHLTGTLDGSPVDIVVDRTDGCAIDDWDRILGDVLPPPTDAP